MEYDSERIVQPKREVGKQFGLEPGSLDLPGDRYASPDEWPECGPQFDYFPYPQGPWLSYGSPETGKTWEESCREAVKKLLDEMNREPPPSVQ